MAIQASEDGTQPRVAQVAEDTPERGDREAQELRISSWRKIVGPKADSVPAEQGP